MRGIELPAILRKEKRYLTEAEVEHRLTEVNPRSESWFVTAHQMRGHHLVIARRVTTHYAGQGAERISAECHRKSKTLKDLREYGRSAERSWRLAVTMVGQVMKELIELLDEPT